jgi:hypothetical protein
MFLLLIEEAREDLFNYEAKNISMLNRLNFCIGKEHVFFQLIDKQFCFIFKIKPRVNNIYLDVCKKEPKQLTIDLLYLFKVLPRTCLRSFVGMQELFASLSSP